MAHKTQNEKRAEVRRQRLRRRAGDVKRLEVVLTAEGERDQYVASWMNDNLGRGEASEFTRLALEEKVAREITGESEMARQFNSMFQLMREKDHIIEQLLARLDHMSEQLADLQRRPITIAQTFTPEQEPPTIQQSSGINMSRERPRPKLQPGPVVVAEPEAPQTELTEEESIRLAQIMAASIKNAQPGRR